MELNGTIYSADPDVPGWDWGDRSVTAVRNATYAPDERDLARLRECMANRHMLPGVQVGDWIDFADGTARRVSHVWDDGAQTSDGGSFYLSKSGHGSFSGSLYPPVPLDSLTASDQRADRPAQFWFFHHGQAQAHNAVHVRIDVTVWQCNLPAPK